MNSSKKPIKKILLLGNGGREHSIATFLKKSQKYEIELFGFFNMKNPKMIELCENFYITDEYNFGEKSNFAMLKKFAEISHLDFAIIGPDDPIAAGAADALLEIGIKSFAPTKKAAQLESSKGFTRSLLKEFDIEGNAEFQRFSSGEQEKLEKYCKNISHKFVIKDDGLCGGKGVFVQDDHFTTAEEGIEIAQKILEKSESLVIEEKLEGPEFSLMFLADGKTVKETPTIADHKRAFEGDNGPNTGGMGTISFPEKLPFITDENIAEAKKITEKVMNAIEEKTGEKFIGVMYGGFMRTQTGTKVIEYNARFGDPEALNFFSLLETDFVDICEHAIAQRLDEINISFSKKATVCKYLVPEGYPTQPVKGVEIYVDESKIGEDVNIFYASVYEDENGKLLLGGSRAIGLVGIDEDFETAREKVNKALECVTGPVFSRKDIGSKELLEKRMKESEDMR